MLKINSTGLVDIFLQRYNLWKDCNRFYYNSGPSLVVKDSTGIPVFHQGDISNINACTSDIVAIDCLTEGVHCANKFNQYVNNKHYLIFSNGGWDKQQHPEITVDYSLIYSYYFLWDMLDTHGSPGRFCFYIDKDYKFEYPKPSMFTSTIGNTRPIRTHIVNQLQKLPYTNYILRYSGQDLGIASNNLDIVNFAPGNFDPYTPIIDRHHHNVSQTLPIDLYNQSYFNLVVETDVEYQNSFFLTEKTIKSLIAGMPFVLVATPHFLKNLRALGFTTYNEFWDESYDDELDHYKRIDKIVNLCQELNTFNWAKYQSDLELVKLKNRNNFFKLSSLATQEFENFEQIIKELKL
jgi:hypothetical protein